MAEVLSQAQIDELLGSLQSGNVDIKEMEEQSSTKKIKEYDFASPKKFTREQLKLLNNIFDNFARLCALHLTSILRTTCQMEVIQVEEEEYREFNNALNDSVLVGIIGMHNEEHNIDDKQILMEISRPISFSMMDRMLGGNGSGYAIEREYTDIEISIMEYLLKQIVSELNNAWTNYIEIKHSLDMLETNSRLIQFIQPDESAAIVTLEVTIKELKGNINICLPAIALEEIFKIFNSKYAKQAKKGDPEQEKLRKEQIMESLKDSPLKVSAILGKSEITLKELLELQPGDIIPLNTTVSGDSIVVNVENLHWFTGTMGTKKKKYAIKIGQVL